MPDRYWVGGTANWDGTAGTKWATTSGGAGGASVPTSADDVYFDAASGAVTCTVTAAANCAGLNFTGFTGTFAGSVSVNIHGSAVISATTTWSHTGSLVFRGGGSRTLISSGKAITGGIDILLSTTLSLLDALTTGTIGLTSGTFTTNNFNVTATSLSSSNSNTRTINLGSSTVTLSTGTATAFNAATSTNLTFNAGTSQINFTAGTTSGIASGGLTFHNVSFTGVSLGSVTITGANTFNNLSVAGRTSAGIANVSCNANQTVNGTLTLSAGTNATMRTFVRSDTIGTTQTLTCAAVASLTDIDFRDITIAGAAAPVSGTRLGDCKGNSGITFPAGKTVWWRGGTGTFGAANWAATSGGGTNTANFPLAQDTAIFDDANVTTGATATVNAAYNLGTLNMSGLTSNTMTLATGSTTPTIYGNWINGTGTTLTGTGLMTFAGRGSQTITSAGRTFTQSFAINTPSGSVTLQDAFTSSNNTSSAINSQAGTFSDGGYAVTLSGASSGVNTSNTGVRTINIGLTWTLGGTSGWNAGVSTNLTVTGTGTISLTSASAKTFIGGGIQTYPTINQGGTGTLTISGSNKFANITNTAIGRVQFTGGTTNIFDAFNLLGSVGNLLQLGSTNTTQAILQKPTAWRMGLLSSDAGNNTGLTFISSDGTMENLSVSYINGTVVALVPSSTANFLMFF